jgi:hypothetical protein
LVPLNISCVITGDVPDAIAGCGHLSMSFLFIEAYPFAGTGYFFT